MSDPTSLSSSKQTAEALRSARCALLTAGLMVNSISALFDQMEIADAMSSNGGENGYEMLGAVEACLGRIKREASDSYKLADAALRGLEVPHD